MTTTMLLLGAVSVSIGIYINYDAVVLTGHMCLIGSILYGKIEAAK